jgi:hypothetical protein
MFWSQLQWIFAWVIRLDASNSYPCVFPHWCIYSSIYIYSLFHLWRWYAEKFLKGQWEKEECVTEWEAYRACVLVLHHDLLVLIFGNYVFSWPYCGSEMNRNQKLHLYAGMWSLSAFFLSKGKTPCICYNLVTNNLLHHLKQYIMVHISFNYVIGCDLLVLILTCCLSSVCIVIQKRMEDRKLHHLFNIDTDMRESWVRGELHSICSL